MKIKSYKKLKNNCYQITFEGNREDIVLYDDIILKYNLLLKKEISEKELTIMAKENQSLSCYYKAIQYLSTRNRCKKEIYTYLKSKAFCEQDIVKAIQLLEKKGFINEERYLESFVHDQIYLNGNGPTKIKNKLLNLGFSEEQVKQSILKVPESVWQEKLASIIEKKVQSNKKDGIHKIKEKVLSYCYNEGYQKEDILSILDHMEFPKNNATLEKEARKLYMKLQLKYQEPNLSYQVKAKLLNKGFLYEDIEEILSQIKSTTL